MPPIFAQQIYPYQSSADGIRTLLATASDGTGGFTRSNQVVYWDANGNQKLIFNPVAGAGTVRVASSRDYAFFADGQRADLLKWNIDTGITPWGLNSPTIAPSVGAPVSGAITLTSGRNYFIAFVNPNTSDYSDLSPISASTGALTAQNIPLTSLQVATQTGVTSKVLLATADGGDPTVLYLLATLSNATTTYTDSTPEATLLASSVYQETDSSGTNHGLLENVPPPNALYPTTHNGRIFMLKGQTLYFSKSLAEVVTSSGIVAGRYESTWPIPYSLTISAGAEQGRGLLSDGTTLYIGTEQNIHRLTGDGPDNFSEPNVLHNNTGILSQDVWKVVYVEETPVGTMWLTPDFRCLSSDFNTFENVGVPIQSTLNSINTNATSAAWALAVESGPYCFYVLAIPTGSNVTPDTLCVYDLHLKNWYIWTCADNWLSAIFYVSLTGIPRWIAIDNNGNTRVFDPKTIYDRQNDPVSGNVPIVSTIKTSWLPFGDKNTRKSLNELEVETATSNATVTIEGATNIADFTTPHSVVSNRPLVLSPFGQYKVYTAGSSAIDRHYRMTIASSSNGSSSATETVLGAYSFEVFPINKI